MPEYNQGITIFKLKETISKRNKHIKILRLENEQLKVALNNELTVIERKK